MAHRGKIYPFHGQRDYGIVQSFTQNLAQRLISPPNLRFSSKGLAIDTNPWYSDYGVVDDEAGTIKWTFPPGGWIELPCTMEITWELTFLESPAKWHRSIAGGDAPASWSTIAYYPPSGAVLPPTLLNERYMYDSGDPTAFVYFGMAGIRYMTWEEFENIGITPEVV